MRSKVQKELIDTGFGFPVTLRNVPMAWVRGMWTPQIDYNSLAHAVLLALSQKPSRLTGYEVRFIRNCFEMTLQEFARRFSVSHAAVLKWEGMKNKPILAHWATEKDLRLFVLSQLGESAKELARLYKALEVQPDLRSTPVQLDMWDLAA